MAASARCVLLSVLYSIYTFFCVHYVPGGPRVLSLYLYLDFYYTYIYTFRIKITAFFVRVSLLRPQCKFLMLWFFFVFFQFHIFSRRTFVCRYTFVAAAAATFWFCYGLRLAASRRRRRRRVQSLRRLFMKMFCCAAFGYMKSIFFMYATLETRTLCCGHNICILMCGCARVCV